MSPDPKILSQHIQQQKQKLRKAAGLENSFIELSRSLKEEVEEIVALAAKVKSAFPFCRTRSW